MKNIRTLFLATLLCGGVMSVSRAQADALADITARGVLKVAVPRDFPPFGSVGPDLKPAARTSTPRNCWLTGSASSWR